MHTTRRGVEGNDRKGRALFPIGAFLLGAIALAGCGPAGDEEDMVLETMTIGEESLTDRAQAVDADDEDLDIVYATTIAGMGPTFEAIQGQVAILTEGSGATLQLALSAHGLTPGDHAWHIHRGPCGSSTDVVIALSATETREAVVGPLAVDQTGVVEVTAEVPPLTHGMVGNQSHSLHIHALPGLDHGPSVACATI